MKELIDKSGPTTNDSCWHNGCRQSAHVSLIQKAHRMCIVQMSKRQSPIVKNRNKKVNLCNFQRVEVANFKKVVMLKSSIFHVGTFCNWIFFLEPVLISKRIFLRRHDKIPNHTSLKLCFDKKNRGIKLNLHENLEDPT